MMIRYSFYICISFLLISAQVINAGVWIADSKTKCKAWNEKPEPNETISWSGKCINGYATGSGILQWFQKGTRTDRFEGEMNKGKLHGKGIFIWENGGKYEGDFVDGIPHGKGILIWANGNDYKGDFVKGKCTGKGIFTWMNNSKYEGDFVNGQLHGKGKYTCYNGKTHIGNWENDRPIRFIIKCE